jgi:GAF domain-containing protein
MLYSRYLFPLLETAPMRTFQVLDRTTHNPDTGTLLITAQNGSQLAMQREGDYLAMSVSFGPIEIALRPRFQEVVRTLAHLRPLDGLQTSRQVGTVEAYLAVGLHSDGRLFMRPTLVQDATGHFSFNLELTSEARTELFKWLGIGS